MRVLICAIRASRNSFNFIETVQDLPRHLGQHSGGMVICQGQLDSVVPLEPAAMPGRVVVQWDKEDCADLGLIKVDLLGLGMMAVLEESIQIDSRCLSRRSRSGASAAGRPGGLRGSAKSRHDWHVSGRKPRADVLSAAAAAAKVLRHRGAGGDHSARPDCRQHGPSLFEAPAGSRAGYLCASCCWSRC